MTSLAQSFAAWRSSLAASGKLRAFLIHLALSATVVGVVALGMLWQWYPQPWFMRDGGWTVFRIILAVDVVLGPLLTLIVFRRGKPELVRDLSIIATLQLGALAFGVTTMLLHRPAYIVYAEENFFAVTWKQAHEGTRDRERLASLASQTRQSGLPLFYLDLPANPVVRRELRNAQSQGGPLIVALGDYYRPLRPDDWQRIMAHGPDIEALASRDPAIAGELQRFKASHAQSMPELAFIPVVCRNDVVMLAVNRSTGATAGWLD